MKKIELQQDAHQQNQLINCFTIAGIEKVIPAKSSTIDVCKIINNLIPNEEEKVSPNNFKRITINQHNKTTYINLEVNDIECKKSIFYKRKDFRLKNIYISERLTPLRSQIFKKARELCATKVILAAWTKNGNIYYKRKEGERGLLLHSIFFYNFVRFMIPFYIFVRFMSCFYIFVRFIIFFSLTISLYQYHQHKSKSFQ